MHRQPTTADATIAALAARAHGTVTNREMRDAGITRDQTRTRIDRGSVLPVFRGVYRVGHKAASTEATYMAAVKACGKDATLSGRAAAHLLGLIRGNAPPPEVIAPTKKDINGIDTHRHRLHPSERTKHNRIPTTTPARTLVDLAASLDEPALSRAVHEAQVRFKVTPTQVERILSRHANAPGARTLRRIIHGDSGIKLSALETAFLELLKTRDLPLPQTNRKASGRYVDCRWPDQHLTVELDSYRFHNTRESWERDRRREREAYRRRDQLRRYT